MKKVLVLVGPTAIGKTSLSIKLAKMFDGEIISGDSIQVYRGLDIGSGKVTRDEMNNVPHYGIDILNPNEAYNAFEFQKMGRKYIDDISLENRLPIICGGTGLYIKALVYDYEFAKHDAIDISKYEDMTNEEMYEELKKLDEKALNTIHVNNRQRLIRALALAHNKTPISETKKDKEHQLIYDTLFIGLTSDRENVYNRINMRVDQMFENGLEEEIKNLRMNGIDYDNHAMQGIGYKEFKDYEDGLINLEEVKELIKRNSRRFAKRQYTWFNNQVPIKWFDINDIETLIKEVNKWMQN